MARYGHNDVCIYSVLYICCTLYFVSFVIIILLLLQMMIFIFEQIKY